MNMTTVTIDATNQKLGRLATTIADTLREKNLPTYKPNVAGTTRVVVTNVDKLDLSPQRLKEEYSRYSGYPGGLTHESRGHLIDRLGYSPVLMHAVRGMLPKNRLRDAMLKNLIIEEPEK